MVHFGRSLRNVVLPSVSKQVHAHAHAEEGSTLLVVVGGGAAGVYGALRAKALSSKLQVLVLEKNQLLSKVKISGGGRCNVTTGLYHDSLALSENYPRGHKQLKGSYFRQHGPCETAAWFEEHGVHLKTEEDGRMFPITNDSATVVGCLLSEAQRLQVNLQTRTIVSAINHDVINGKFRLQVRKRGSEETAELIADFVLLATGSAAQGYELAEQLGHSVVKPMPSLFTFKVSDPSLCELAGVSFPCARARLEIVGQKRASPYLTQEGPLLVTHWGLSGPCILKLSAWAARELFQTNYQASLVVDYLPKMNGEEVINIFKQHKLNFPKRKLDSGAPYGIECVRRFWQYLLVRQNVDAESLWSNLTKRDMYEMVDCLKKCSFQVSGKGVFKEEFVTSGGIPLEEVNLKTMESKKCKGVYLAGELLDVDGVTGGFNFQNAWTGGYLAGSAIAASSLA